MKTINKLKFLTAALVAVTFFFTACNDENEGSIQQDLIDEEAIALEESVESDFSDIDDITMEGMDLEVYSEDPGSRLLKRPRHRIPECAEVTHDHEANLITIDFGDGCEGKGGKVFTGKIFISYTGRRLIPGSEWTTTFEEFTIDGNQILGVHKVQNISTSLEDNPTFFVTLTDGQILWADGDVSSREHEKTKVWVRATNPLNDEFHVLAGSVANGVTKAQVTYSMEVLEDIVIKNICKLEGIHVPVDGVKKVVKDDREYIIDFGDGECDNLAEVTSGDETITVELPRRRN